MVERDTHKVGWTIDDSFDPMELGMIDTETFEHIPAGDIIPAEVATRAIPKKVDTSKAMERWLHEQSSRKSKVSALITVLFMILVGAFLVCAMIATAEAGDAFMTFTVANVGDEFVIVVDDNGDTFSFYRDRSPKVEKGDKIIACTHLTYKGDKKWIWNTNKTAIIAVKGD